MTIPRVGLYVWVTWLSRMMSGDKSCHWGPWFKAHFTNYEKEPTGFEAAVWTAEHTQLLDEIITERTELGEGTYIEGQNSFKAKRPSGLVIAGKPDLITVNKNGEYKVYDAKTGKPRHSDIIQIMLYMMLLPYSTPIYSGKQFSGCAVYKDGQRSEIPYSAINKDFKDNGTYFLDILESDKQPEKTASKYECRYCDISKKECGDRIDTVNLDTDEDDLDIPEIPL